MPESAKCAPDVGARCRSDVGPRERSVFSAATSRVDSANCERFSGERRNGRRRCGTDKFRDERPSCRRHWDVYPRSNGDRGGRRFGQRSGAGGRPHADAGAGALTREHRRLSEATPLLLRQVRRSGLLLRQDYWRFRRRRDAPDTAGSPSHTPGVIGRAGDARHAQPPTDKPSPHESVCPFDHAGDARCHPMRGGRRKQSGRGAVQNPAIA